MWELDDEFKKPKYHKPSPEGRYKKVICVMCSATELDYYVSYPCKYIEDKDVQTV